MCAGDFLRKIICLWFLSKFTKHVWPKQKLLNYNILKTRLNLKKTWVKITERVNRMDFDEEDHEIMSMLLVGWKMSFIPT